MNSARESTGNFSEVPKGTLAERLLRHDLVLAVEAGVDRDEDVPKWALAVGLEKLWHDLRVVAR